MARSRRRPEQNPEPEVVDDPEALEAAEAEVAELDEQDDETGTDSGAASDDARDPDAFDGFDDDIARVVVTREVVIDRVTPTVVRHGGAERESA